MHNSIKLTMMVSALALTTSLGAMAADPVADKDKDRVTQAQTAPTTPATPSTPTKPVAGIPTGADAQKLIGRNVKNADDETIGEIKSVHIGADGKVDQLIVGVGGFLGVGEREVAIAWNDLTISGNGERVVANMSKDQLKALPEYKYSDPSYRGRIFGDRGIIGGPTRTGEVAPPTTPREPAGTVPGRTRTAETEPGRTKPMDAPGTARDAGKPPASATKAFNTSGEMSGEAVIGATVRNQQNETVGSINDIYLDSNGAVKTVIVSVGGFLGMGSHDVALPWSDLSFGRDGSSLIVTTSATKDHLKALPAFKREQAQAK
jgi:hypothetical protein